MLDFRKIAFFISRVSIQNFYFWIMAQRFLLLDSYHTMNARTPEMIKPKILTHRGIRIPFIFTSQPRNSLSTCMTETRARTKIVTFVKGFIIIYF
jgi:hypothetical protein